MSARNLDRTRIVLDTNLLVSGLIIPRGVPYRLLAEWRRGSFRLLVSDAILDEYAAVLARPQFATKYDLTAADVAALLRRMRMEGERVMPTETVPVAVRDPKDVHLLAAALGGNAAYLITGDADLLVLNADLALGPLRIATARLLGRSCAARMRKSRRSYRTSEPSRNGSGSSARPRRSTSREPWRSYALRVAQSPSRCQSRIRRICVPCGARDGTRPSESAR